MDAVCFIFQVELSFKLSISGISYFFNKGDVVLSYPENMCLFLPFVNEEKILLLNDEQVYKYLVLNDSGFPYLCRQKSSFLKVFFNNMTLVKEMIEITNQNKGYDNYNEMICLACLAIFSVDEQLLPFLTDGISSISKKVRCILDSDVSKRWMLCDIARTLCISESLLKKKLKNENISFSQLLLEVRMKKAKSLLKMNKHSVNKVSELCGYNSPSYFINVYRRHFGTTPSQSEKYSEMLTLK